MSDDRFEEVTRENKAWKITEENVSTLSIISGKPEDLLTLHIGMYLVDDWGTPFDRFLILPDNYFRYHFPYLKVENEDNETED